MFKILKNEGVQPIDVSKKLNISFQDFNELIFGIAQELTDHLSDLRRTKLKLVIKLLVLMYNRNVYIYCIKKLSTFRYTFCLKVTPSTYRIFLYLKSCF